MIKTIDKLRKKLIKKNNWRWFEETSSYDGKIRLHVSELRFSASQDMHEKLMRCDEITDVLLELMECYRKGTHIAMNAFNYDASEHRAAARNIENALAKLEKMEF